MEIFTELITYFGIEMIGQAETFPELLQYFLMSMFSIYLIVLVISTMFNAVWHIKNDLK